VVDLGYSSTRLSCITDGFYVGGKDIPFGGYHAMKVLFETKTKLKYDRESLLVAQFEELVKGWEIGKKMEIDGKILKVDESYKKLYINAYKKPKKYSDILGFEKKEGIIEDGIMDEIKTFFDGLDQEFDKERHFNFEGPIATTLEGYLKKITKKIKKSDYQTTVNGTFVGGAILGSLSTFKSMWTDKYSFSDSNIYDDEVLK